MLIREIFKGVCSEYAKRHIFQCGVEHELENFYSDYFDIAGLQTRFNVESDGSLVNGIELTTYPGGVEQQMEFYNCLLQNFPQQYKVNKNKPIYSDRTSTHVHVCVADLTETQLISLVYMYSLLEPYFFSYVGEEREHNIHCVPLWATGVMQKLGKVGASEMSLVQQLQTYVGSWHKYTALNLKPMKNLNTIEFRHLFGTDHVQSFETWLHILEALYYWAQKNGDRFFTTELKSLLTAGYPIVERYILTQTGDLGEYMSSLTPFVNRERCYDVYLSTLTNLFGGAPSISNLSRGAV